MASNNNLPSNGLPSNLHFDDLPSNDSSSNGSPSNGSPSDDLPLNGLPFNGQPSHGLQVLSNGLSLNGQPFSGLDANSPPTSASFSVFYDPLLAENLRRAILYSRISIRATKEVIRDKLHRAPEFQHKNYVLHWNQMLVFDKFEDHHWLDNLHLHRAMVQDMCSRIESVGLSIEQTFRQRNKGTWFDAGFNIRFVTRDDEEAFEVRLRENLPPSITMADVFATNFSGTSAEATINRAFGGNGTNVSTIGTNGTNGWMSVNRVNGVNGVNEMDSDSPGMSMSSGMTGMDSDSPEMSSWMTEMDSDSPEMASGMTRMDSDSPGMDYESLEMSSGMNGMGCESPETS